MKCGRPRVSDGQPCQQNVGAAGCIWHGDDATDESRSAIARLGSPVSRQVLPKDTPYEPLDDPEGCRRVLADIAHWVKTDALAPQRALAVVACVRAAIELAALQISSQVRKLERAVMNQGRRSA